MIKRLMYELNLYRKFTCTDKNNDKNKTSLPPPPSTPVTVFLIAEKLLSPWLWNVQIFSSLLSTVL